MRKSTCPQEPGASQSISALALETPRISHLLSAYFTSGRMANWQRRRTLVPSVHVRMWYRLIACSDNTQLPMPRSSFTSPKGHMSEPPLRMVIYLLIVVSAVYAIESIAIFTFTLFNALLHS